MNRLSFFRLLSLTGSLLASFVFWLAWRNNPELSLEWSRYLWPLLTLALFVLSLNLTFLIEKKIIVVTFLVFISLLLFIISGRFDLFSILAFISSLGLILSYADFRADLSLYKKIAIPKALKTNSILFFLALNLGFLTIAHSRDHQNYFEVKIPPAIVDFSKNLTRQFLQEQIANQLPAGQRMNLPAVREQYFTQSEKVIDEQTQNLKVSLEQSINSFLLPYQVYFPYFVGLFLFLSLTSLSPILNPLINLIFLAEFRIFLNLKMFGITFRSEEVEHLDA